MCTSINSTCCCKETASTTGWNHCIFYPHYTGISKVAFLPLCSHFMQAYVVWNARIYSKRTSVCCAIWIALSVKGIYCTTELFWKQLMNEVGVKIILILSSRWWRFVTAASAIDGIFSVTGIFSHEQQTVRAVASLTNPGEQDFHFPHSFLKFPSVFLIFPSKCSHFLPHFGPPGGGLAHPERSWLHYCKQCARCKTTWHKLPTCLTYLPHINYPLASCQLLKWDKV